MGKPKREKVWKNFRQFDDKSVICIYCDLKYKKGNVNRMERHLKKCFKCPENIKAGLNETITSETINLQGEKENVSPNSLNSTTAAGPSSASYNVTLSEEQQRILNLDLAKAMYVTGSPLAMVEHPLWKGFFEKIQPLYTLPSRKAISTTFLDKIYGDMRNELIAELTMQNYLHLQCDGWSNVRCEGIFNFVISKPEPVFIKSIETTDNRHTSEYLSQEIQKVMAEFGESKFFVLVGDNARNVQKAFQLVQINQPHVTYLNCISHTLNRLCEDILKPGTLHDFINVATNCIKTIKKSQILSSLLTNIVKEKQAGETLKLPCKTRWGSHCASLESLQNTKNALQTLAVHEKATALPANIKSSLLDEDFWVRTKHTICILKPISTAIFKLESDKFNIHTVYLSLRNMKSQLEFALLEIDNMLTADEKDEILMATFNRMTMCIKPIHLAAYMLDPATQGAEMDEDELVSAMQYINSAGNHLNIEVMPNLGNYRAKDGNLWGKPFVWSNVNNMHPVTWWKGICSSTLLSKVAIRILTAPCTSAAVERSFSTHGRIHSKIRNRLTATRAAKIAFVAHNWNIRNRINTCNSDEEESPAATPAFEVESLNDESNENVSPRHLGFEFFDFNSINNDSDSDD